jgi:hypothetical protein
MEKQFRCLIWMNYFNGLPWIKIPVIFIYTNKKRKHHAAFPFLLNPKIELDFVQFRLQMIDDFNVVNICFAIYSEVV